MRDGRTDRFSRECRILLAESVCEQSLARRWQAVRGRCRERNPGDTLRKYRFNRGNNRDALV